MHELSFGLESEMEVGHIMRARLRARIKELNTNPKHVSLKAGLGESAVGDILRGRSNSPQLQTLEAIAKALDCHLNYLLGKQDKPNVQPLIEAQIRPIPIAGVAEAGSFRVATTAAPEAEYEMGSVVASRSPRFSKARHFAFEVRGNSMNAATRKGRPSPITEGMLVLCVDLEDAGIEIESGEIYVVRRTRDHGQTYEFTVKKAVLFRDRTELRSESTDSRHETLVIPHDPQADESHQVLAIGWVYAALIDLSSSS